MAKAEGRGLVREESLHIFLDWYAFGGWQKGLTLQEVMDAPAWLLLDFRYLIVRLEQLKKRAKRRRKRRKEKGAK